MVFIPLIDVCLALLSRIKEGGTTDTTLVM